MHGRPVRRPDLTVATMDHNVPTTRGPVTDQISARQMQALAANAKEFGVTLYPMGSPGQGIVHVIGPEQGYTQPGLVIVCGDSHTSTHGAFGALAFGIGTSEVEHVLATQTLPQNRPGTMAVTVDGDLPGRLQRQGRHPGDHQSHRHRWRRGSHHRVPRLRDPRPLHGRPHDDLQHVDRGAARGRAWWRPTTPRSPTSRAGPTLRRATTGSARCEDWRSLPTDDGATFDREVTIDATAMRPYVSWGTNPAQSVTIDDAVPDPDAFDEPSKKEAAARALAYMDLTPGTAIRDIRPDTIFIGSCTNSRMEDLRVAATVVDGKKVAQGLRALVVPGSFAVKQEAEAEGLDRVFESAGFEWRGAGCSMCLGMNPDTLNPGDRSASTSNRNFEGRQGKGGRTHLVSPRGGRRHGHRGSLHHARGALSRRWTPSPIIEGTALPVDRSDVDTDQIIPAEYLKRIERTGFGPFLFAEWRKDPAFVINDERYDGASILLAGENFGCGSSREHAPWAIEDAGFKAVIAPSFADIFRNNCTKIGLLPVELRAESVRALMDAVPGRPCHADRRGPRRRSPCGRPALTRRSTWRTSPAGASWRAWTTSASPSATRTRSRPTKRPAPPGYPSPDVPGLPMLLPSPAGTRRRWLAYASGSRFQHSMWPAPAHSSNCTWSGSNALSSRLVATGTVSSAVPWNTRNGSRSYGRRIGQIVERRPVHAEPPRGQLLGHRRQRRAAAARPERSPHATRCRRPWPRSPAWARP